MSKTVEKVCPLESDLSRDVCKNIACPVSGCKKILPQLSALRFHKIKVHGILENETDRRISRHQKPSNSQTEAVHYQYHCPSSCCTYSLNGMKYFKTFKLLKQIYVSINVKLLHQSQPSVLEPYAPAAFVCFSLFNHFAKQHYMKVHAVKRHVCNACDASFGLAYDLNRHLKNCRVFYNAQSEDVWYMTSSDDVGILPTGVAMCTQTISKDAHMSQFSSEISSSGCDVTSSIPTENIVSGGVVNSSEDLSEACVAPETRSIHLPRNCSVRNSSLLPKPNGFLLPMLLPVIIMPVDTGARPRRLVPKTFLVGENSGRQYTATNPEEVSLSIATQCSRSAGGLRQKAAQTQTVPPSVVQSDHPSCRHRKKDLTKGPLQVSSRSTGLRKYRAICHSHTQTHGKHLKSHLVCQSMTTLSKSNATQTIDWASQESTRTQTVESYLSHSDSLFTDTTWLPITADHDDKNCAAESSNLQPSVEVEYPLGYVGEVELFNSSRDVSEQFDRLLGELVDETAPRLSLTSASQQTVAIDNDAVSTQTMDCDFDTGDFDLSNNETQTELLDVLFGFSDIETQTAHQMQLWDSETQTCFDSLL